MPADPNRRPPVSQSRLSRRAMLRVLATLPIIGAVASRTGGSRGPFAAARQTGTPSPTIGCAGSPAAMPAASPVGSPTPAVTVKMTTQLRFEPEHVTVKVGETIAWVNESTLPHTATGAPEQNPVATSHPEYVRLPDGAEPWGSELLQPGESYVHTFTIPGEYKYLCIPHVLSGMRGTITVEC